MEDAVLPEMVEPEIENEDDPVLHSIPPLIVALLFRICALETEMVESETR